MKTKNEAKTAPEAKTEAKTAPEAKTEAKTAPAKTAPAKTAPAKTSSNVADVSKRELMQSRIRTLYNVTANGDGTTSRRFKGLKQSEFSGQAFYDAYMLHLVEASECITDYSVLDGDTSPEVKTAKSALYKKALASVNKAREVLEVQTGLTFPEVKRYHFDKWLMDYTTMRQDETGSYADDKSWRYFKQRLEIDCYDSVNGLARIGSRSNKAKANAKARENAMKHADKAKTAPAKAKTEAPAKAKTEAKAKAPAKAPAKAKTEAPAAPEAKTAPEAPAA